MQTSDPQSVASSNNDIEKDVEIVKQVDSTPSDENDKVNPSGPFSEGTQTKLPKDTVGFVAVRTLEEDLTPVLGDNAPVISTTEKKTLQTLGEDSIPLSEPSVPVKEPALVQAAVPAVTSSPQSATLTGESVIVDSSITTSSTNGSALAAKETPSVSGGAESEGDVDMSKVV